jgi:hypothetical protein
MSVLRSVTYRNPPRPRSSVEERACPRMTPKDCSPSQALTGSWRHSDARTLMTSRFSMVNASGGDPRERERSRGARQTKASRRIAVRYKFGLHDEAHGVVRQGAGLEAHDALLAGHGQSDADLSRLTTSFRKAAYSYVQPWESSRMTRSPLSSVGRSQKSRWLLVLGKPRRCPAMQTFEPRCHGKPIPSMCSAPLRKAASFRAGAVSTGTPLRASSRAQLSNMDTTSIVHGRAETLYTKPALTRGSAQ